MIRTYIDSLGRRALFLLGVLSGLVLTLAILGAVALTLISSVNSAMETRLAVEAPPYAIDLEPARLTARSDAERSRPLEWLAYDLAAKRVTKRAEIQDGRHLVLNLWATWCTPCIAEMPGLERLHELLPKDQFEVAMLSWEPQPRVEAFFDDNPSTLRQLVLRGAAPPELTSGALPQTLILDPRGEVVARHRGAADWSSPESVADLIELARSSR